MNIGDYETKWPTYEDSDGSVKCVDPADMSGEQVYQLVQQELADMGDYQQKQQVVIHSLHEEIESLKATIANALSELTAGDVQSAIDQLEAGNE